MAKVPEKNRRISDKSNLQGSVNQSESFWLFFAFDDFDIFGMCEADIDVILEIIKNRNTILTSGFQANMIAIIFDKPVVKPLDIRVDSWKGFLFVFGYTVLVSDCCNDNIFVEVKITADGVF